MTDTPEKTPIHVLKTSENGEGMPVYGTVYTVYSDAECTKEVGTLTVGDDGRSNVLEVLYGTYYSVFILRYYPVGLLDLIIWPPSYNFCRISVNALRRMPVVCSTGHLYSSRT